MAPTAVLPKKQPSACIGCRSCGAVCPQRLRISEGLADFTEQLKKSPHLIRSVDSGAKISVCIANSGFFSAQKEREQQV